MFFKKKKISAVELQHDKYVVFFEKSKRTEEFMKDDAPSDVITFINTHHPVNCLGGVVVWGKN